MGRGGWCHRAGHSEAAGKALPAEGRHTIIESIAGLPRRGRTWKLSGFRTACKKGRDGERGQNGLAAVRLWEEGTRRRRMLGEGGEEVGKAACLGLNP